jgi:NAD(P)-dependent dehydrogenase (short-subunit alcohol dehydrogenase family)
MNGDPVGDRPAAGRLNGKIAVVTGGADGMGRSTVHRFVQQGARVVIADVQDQKGAEVAEVLGDAARFVHCDVRREDEMANAVEVAARDFGGLDIMQHFAATAGTQDAIEDIAVDEWDDAQAVLVRASMLAIKAAVPEMRRRGGGAVTLTSSAAAYLPGPTSSVAYVTGKSAVVALARVAALRYAPDFIRINVIVPGAFATPIGVRGLGYSAEMAERMIPLLKDDLYAKYQPIPRAGELDDIASAALFLASNEAGFITGADVRVDGGMSLRHGITRDQFVERVHAAAAHVLSEDSGRVRIDDM